MVVCILSGLPLLCRWECIPHFTVFLSLGGAVIYNRCPVMFALMKDERSAALSSALNACSWSPRFLELPGGIGECRE